MEILKLTALSNGKNLESVEVNDVKSETLEQLIGGPTSSKVIRIDDHQYELVFNATGKDKGLSPAVIIMSENRIYDFIAGTVYIFDGDNKQEGGLDNEDIERVKKFFEHCELSDRIIPGVPVPVCDYFNQTF